MGGGQPSPGSEAVCEAGGAGGTRRFGKPWKGLYGNGVAFKSGRGFEGAERDGGARGGGRPRRRHWRSDRGSRQSDCGARHRRPLQWPMRLPQRPGRPRWCEWPHRWAILGERCLRVRCGALLPYARSEHSAQLWVARALRGREGCGLRAGEAGAASAPCDDRLWRQLREDCRWAVSRNCASASGGAAWGGSLGECFTQAPRATVAGMKCVCNRYGGGRRRMLH